MTRVDELLAEAKDLYDQAKKIADADERLAVILRAVGLEMDADALRRGGPPVPSPRAIDEGKGGGDPEQA